MSLLDFINQGGAIGYILLTLNIFGWATMAFKIYHIREFKQGLVRTGEGILAEAKKINSDREVVRELIKEKTQNAIQPLESGLFTVKTIGSIAPMIGLLGTVVGLWSSFKVIGESGLDNPSLFATHIGMALVTTILGLIVAIPHIIGHNYFNRMLDQLEYNLDQSVVDKFYRETST